MGCIQPKSDGGVHIVNDRGIAGQKFFFYILERTKRLSTFTVSSQGFIKEKHSSLYDDYQMGDVIGKGTFSKLF